MLLLTSFELCLSMVKLFVENLSHYVTLLYWGVWLSILSYYQICWILNIGYSYHYDGFCVSWLSVGCCWLYRYRISAHFHSKSIADNTIDIALKIYRRYHDRYQKSIGDTTDIDTFIAILKSLIFSIYAHIKSGIKSRPFDKL